MRRLGHKTILLLLAALAALAVAGCGGGGGETETTASTTEEPQKLTKAELVEQGDDVCAETNAAVGALDSQPEAGAVPATIEKTANLYTGMVEGLQELGTPEGAEGSFTSFMEAAEELAKVEGEVKLAAEREDTAALGEAATEAAPALEEFETQAETYGFEECSQGPGAPTPSSTTGTEGGEEFEGVEEGGVEAEPELEEPAPEEEVVPEEAAPETGGAGGGAGGGAEVAPETGGGGESGGSESGGVGPG